MTDPPILFGVDGTWHHGIETVTVRIIAAAGFAGELRAPGQRGLGDGARRFAVSLSGSAAPPIGGRCRRAGACSPRSKRAGGHGYGPLNSNQDRWQSQPGAGVPGEDLLDEAT